ncbi:type II toxin-antitoxin system HicA family toxin [Bacteroides fragilis]|uniref:type II toxin-antitoxin system HicA family toxin n=1 Tax=Bacteroides fragilis TaxID=817 RepID=UPI0022AA79FE|nr:type II toxin-antitoxin system HicA family toxin [Bacteroides fragilis]MCS2567252.1 type II toxin-antitoxin system HicA family toxin [Bacteroides fragilis]MCZ2503878.1 type II toxin-antitoxin system HicA family toxin [Bacteroides fragilis]
MKNLKVSIIIKKLKEDGWKKVHQSGSHRQFKHPIKKGKVTVNGNKSDDICGILLNSIEKQAGIKF